MTESPKTMQEALSDLTKRMKNVDDDTDPMEIYELCLQSAVILLLQARSVHPNAKNFLTARVSQGEDDFYLRFQRTGGLTPAERIGELQAELEHMERALEFIDTECESIIRRPAMYTGNGSDFWAAELLVLQLLNVWGIAMGGVEYDHRAWLAERYPQIPGPVRSVNAAAKGDPEFFRKEMEAFIAWAKAHKDKVDDEQDEAPSS